MFDADLAQANGEDKRATLVAGRIELCAIQESSLKEEGREGSDHWEDLLSCLTHGVVDSDLVSGLGKAARSETGLIKGIEVYRMEFASKAYLTPSPGVMVSTVTPMMIRSI